MKRESVHSARRKPGPRTRAHCAVHAIFLTLCLFVSYAAAQESALEVVGQLGGACRGVQVAGNLAYIGEGPGLRVLDVTNPVSPVARGRALLDDRVVAIHVVGNTACAVTEGNRLHVVDVSDPASPVLMGSCDVPAVPTAVCAAGGIAYVGWDGPDTAGGGVETIDISNPAAPTLVHSHGPTSGVTGLTVQGSLLYLTLSGPEGMRILDIGDPASPVRLSSYMAGSTVYWSIHVAGNLAYLPELNGFQIVDVSDPSSPTLLGLYRSGLFMGGASSVFVSGSRAYLTVGGIGPNGFQIVDVTDSARPLLLGTYDAPGPTDILVDAIWVASGSAFVAAGRDGMQVVDVGDPSSPTLQGTYLPVTDGWQVEVTGDLAVVNTATGGRPIQIVDISDPAAPVVRGFYPAPYYVSDIEAAGNRVYYVGYENDGLVILDISDPAAPTRLGSYDNLARAVELCLSGDLAYVVDQNNGLRVIDVSDPAAPTLRGIYEEPGFKPGQIHVDGSRAVLAGNTGFPFNKDLRILDVSDPSAPTLLGSYQLPEWQMDITDIRVTADRLYVTWRALGPYLGGGLQILDISQPEAPVVRGTYDVQGVLTIEHLTDNRLYMSNHLPEALLILDVSDPAAPTLSQSYDMGGSLEVVGDLLYMTRSNSGLWILRFPSAPGMANLTINIRDFGPIEPHALRPGDPVVLGAFVENTGAGDSGPFWVEFWGSRTGGITLDYLLADSVYVPKLAASDGVSLALARTFYSVPDGLYTVMFVVDRPNGVAEADEGDNRKVVPGKRLLTLRPKTKANISVEDFTVGPPHLRNGGTVLFGGKVRNTGTEAAGPFWIEFWGSFASLYPLMDFFLCDSLYVADLAPGAAIDLSTLTRTLYPCPAGTFPVGCVADRIDQVNELDETDNYQFIGPVQISP